MKNLILTFTFLFALASCTKKDLYHEAAVNSAKSVMKNPASFKLDSVKIDTLKFSNILEYDFLKTSEEYFKESKEFQRMVGYNYLYSFDEKMAQYEKSSKLSKEAHKISEQIEKIKNTSKDTLVGFQYRVICRGTNSYGAEIQDVVFVLFRKDNVTPIFTGQFDELKEFNPFKS
jgi:hypothetical protein